MLHKTRNKTIETPTFRCRTMQWKVTKNKRWTGLRVKRKKNRRFGAKQKMCVFVNQILLIRISLIGNLCNRRLCYYLLAIDLAVLLVWWNLNWIPNRCPYRCYQRLALALWSVWWDRLFRRWIARPRTGRCGNASGSRSAFLDSVTEYPK